MFAPGAGNAALEVENRGELAIRAAGGLGSPGFQRNQGEIEMVRRSVIAVSAVLALSFLPVTTNAQILRGSTAIPKPAPVFTPAACRAPGPHCRKGHVWRCGAVLGCRCRPC